MQIRYKSVWEEVAIVKFLSKSSCISVSKIFAKAGRLTRVSKRLLCQRTQGISSLFHWTCILSQLACHKPSVQSLSSCVRQRKNVNTNSKASLNYLLYTAAPVILLSCTAHLDYFARCLRHIFHISAINRKIDLCSGKVSFDFDFPILACPFCEDRRLLELLQSCDVAVKAL